jgi:hypothetical protein
VTRLAHDQLERDLLVAEMGRCGVIAQFVDLLSDDAEEA